MDWKNGTLYWKLFEASLQEKLVNSAIPSMIEEDYKFQALLDGKVAEENSKDQHWVKFDKGYHELIINLKQESRISVVFFRVLNYNLESINSPLKTYLFVSDDGISYELISIKDAPFFSNNNHDAWIDALLFSQLSEKARFIKIAFYALDQVYMDELFINPEII